MTKIIPAEVLAAYIKMTSCDFMRPERSWHFNKVSMPFIYNAWEEGRKKVGVDERKTNDSLHAEPGKCYLLESGLDK